MAVLNAQYKHPQSAYSEGLKELIDSMLKVNPAERPEINEVSFYIAFLIVFACLCSRLILYFRLFEGQTEYYNHWHDEHDLRHSSFVQTWIRTLLIMHLLSFISPLLLTRKYIR